MGIEMEWKYDISACTLCPRECGVDRLNGGVDTKIECHRFFHGYHLGLIVTYFALQINNSQTYN